MSASSSLGSASTPTNSDRGLGGGDRSERIDRAEGGGSAASEPDGSPRLEPEPARSGGGPRSPLRRPVRRRLLVAATLAAALLLFDLTRAPAAQWSGRALLGALGVYQATLSPVLGGVGVRCRFVPTCSHYAQDAIRADGALIGAARAVARVARCGPWTPSGTVDPA